MPRASVRDIELEYETHGDPADPTLLLINGLGSQMIAWPDEFCSMFVDRAFHVVRFDNRDIGLSTSFEGGPSDAEPVIAALTAGEDPELAYTMNDMAADAAALLDHLGIDKAHVLGVSMGGMIAQLVAINHPEKTASLTSIMSNTGEREYGQPTEEALAALIQPAADNREDYITQNVASAKIWASPEFWDAEWRAEYLGSTWDRVGGAQAGGTTRQYLAIISHGSRADGLRSLDVPALVIHGDADTLVQVSGGQRTAELIPGATYLEIEGMGHDYPPQITPQIIEAVVALAIRAAA